MEQAHKIATSNRRKSSASGSLKKLTCVNTDRRQTTNTLPSSTSLASVSINHQSRAQVPSRIPRSSSFFTGLNASHTRRDSAQQHNILPNQTSNPRSTNGSQPHKKPTTPSTLGKENGTDPPETVDETHNPRTKPSGSTMDIEQRGLMQPMQPSIALSHPLPRSTTMSDFNPSNNLPSRFLGRPNGRRDVSRNQNPKSSRGEEHDPPEARGRSRTPSHGYKTPYPQNNKRSHLHQHQGKNSNADSDPPHHIHARRTKTGEGASDDGGQRQILHGGSSHFREHFDDDECLDQHQREIQESQREDTPVQSSKNFSDIFDEDSEIVMPVVIEGDTLTAQNSPHTGGMKPQFLTANEKVPQEDSGRRDQALSPPLVNSRIVSALPPLTQIFHTIESAYTRLTICSPYRAIDLQPPSSTVLAWPIHSNQRPLSNPCSTIRPSFFTVFAHSPFPISTDLPRQTADSKFLDPVSPTSLSISVSLPLPLSV